MSISSLFLKIQQLFLFPSKQNVHQTLAKFDLFHLLDRNRSQIFPGCWYLDNCAIYL